MAKIYGYSFCGEIYYGRYTSREEAVAAARVDNRDAGTCLTCCGVDVLPWDYLPSGYDLIEQVEEGIADNHANEDPIFTVTAEQRRDLEQRISRAFREWMQANPRAWRDYYEASEIETHTWAAEEPVSVDAVDPSADIRESGPRA